MNDRILQIERQQKFLAIGCGVLATVVVFLAVAVVILSGAGGPRAANVPAGVDGDEPKPENAGPRIADVVYASAFIVVDDAGNAVAEFGNGRTATAREILFDRHGVGLYLWGENQILRGTFLIDRTGDARLQLNDAAGELGIRGYVTRSGTANFHADGITAEYRFTPPAGDPITSPAR